MKKLLILSSALFISACSYQANDAVNKSLTNINEELVVIQRSITDTKMSVEDVKAAQDLTNADIATNSNAIAELRSEIAYLNNELMLLKSRAGAPIDSTADMAPVTEPMDDMSASTDPVNNVVIEEIPETKTPQQIIIIEDSSAAKNSIYSFALELNRQKKYEEARGKFTEFLTKYPTDPLAGNAQYWIGETYYSVSDNNNALMAFQEVINKYPKSSKVPDAMLKVGYTQEKLNDKTTAATTLKNLVAKYPKSKPAALAKQKLQSWGM